MGYWPLTVFRATSLGSFFTKQVVKHRCLCVLLKSYRSSRYTCVQTAKRSVSLLFQLALLYQAGTARARAKRWGWTREEQGPGSRRRRRQTGEQAAGVTGTQHLPSPCPCTRRLKVPGSKSATRPKPEKAAILVLESTNVRKRSVTIMSLQPR